MVVAYLLPAVRVMVTKKLISQYGMRPAEAARRMEVTPAAITHYMKGSRGRSTIEALATSRKIQKAVSEIAEELSKKNVDMAFVLSKLCQACRALRAEGLLCALHGELVPGLETSGCTICK